MARSNVVMDGNEAAAYVAFRTNEVIAIYPITPASPMGELSDLWNTQGHKNIWGSVPTVVEMQSEGGAAGAVHGSLQAGSLTTTFTASQGLLLMIPNMYKIAGELTPTVFHIAARSLAAQALSIFGDHSDVMAARGAGWGMLFANSVQEVMDFALIAQAASLKSRVPFLHVFDGFRTSHEIRNIEPLSDAQIRALIDDQLVQQHRSRALTPDRPVIRGTAQNPDVFFQARESVNRYYDAVPGIVQGYMDQLRDYTGRAYRLFDYVGAPDAERVVILMGSGCETAHETVDFLASKGEKVGLVKIRLFRPFSGRHLIDALPPTVRTIAALDRTKEPGAAGEPLYQDVVTAVAEDTDRFESRPRVLGGRYGLSSKEFTPAMVKSVLENLESSEPKNHFTIGIKDDVTHTSLDYDSSFLTESDKVTRAVFWGLGSDGTVGANKNSIKIIGEHGESEDEDASMQAQGYFVYDSKKSGARTISHLRFGAEDIHSTYLIGKASFVAVHQFGFLERYDTLEIAEEGATFLLNSPFPADKVWDKIPRKVQAQIIEKKLRFFVIDGYSVAQEYELGVRINTIMQTCFFALAKVIPVEKAVELIKDAIRKTYGKRGEIVVRRNCGAVDAALDHMHEVKVPAEATSSIGLPPVVPASAPDFVQRVTASIMAGFGDDLPVSALPDDGTYPTATTQWEKRNIALDVPVWEPDLCIQCGKCVLACPHAVIRSKVVQESDLAGAPEGFKSMDAGWRELSGQKYTLQVAVEDCTGCQLCVEVCPAKDKSAVGRKALNMADQRPIKKKGRVDWDFFLGLPDNPGGDGAPAPLKYTKVKDVQLLQPYFEFSGACAGCGETPYLILMTRLFGDRAVVANATGCSSIYGGNLPTTPWSVNRDGRGPAWSNSLFEDNAEFGLGMRLALEKQSQYARELLALHGDEIGKDLVKALLEAPEETQEDIDTQRRLVHDLKQYMKDRSEPWARDLASIADNLVRKNVWIIGGDGWAYDIGYGGLDHVLASGKNVNVIVLDTEVYSNTGGQASKATGLGAVAKFAAGGKPTPKKDLAMLAMTYGYVYVAQIALGANENQAIKALQEAESYDGPSIIIAYSQCIAHGIDMAKGMNQQQLAVDSGYWPLFRFDPRRSESGLPQLQLDSKAPVVPLKDYLYNENRYRVLTHVNAQAASKFLTQANEGVKVRWRKLEQMALETATSGDGAPPRGGDGPRKPKMPPGFKPKLPPVKRPPGQ